MHFRTCLVLVILQSTFCLAADNRTKVAVVQPDGTIKYVEVAKVPYLYENDHQPNPDLACMKTNLARLLLDASSWMENSRTHFAAAEKAAAGDRRQALADACEKAFMGATALISLQRTTQIHPLENKPQAKASHLSSLASRLLLHFNPLVEPCRKWMRGETENEQDVLKSSLAAIDATKRLLSNLHQEAFGKAP